MGSVTTYQKQSMQRCPSKTAETLRGGRRVQRRAKYDSKHASLLLNRMLLPPAQQQHTQEHHHHCIGLVSFFLVAVGDGWCGVVGVYYAPAPPALPILGDGL